MTSILVFVDQGIVRALREYQQKLIDGKTKIYVRRAGPNYQEGLRIMRELGKWTVETAEVPLELNLLLRIHIIRNAFRPRLSKRLGLWPNLSRGSGHSGQHQGGTTLLIDGTDSPDPMTCDSVTHFAVLLLLGLPGLAWRLERRAQWSVTIRSQYFFNFYSLLSKTFIE